jgi:hypothetical protein
MRDQRELDAIRLYLEKAIEELLVLREQVKEAERRLADWQFSPSIAMFR